jgi:hypothetical protein
MDKSRDSHSKVFPNKAASLQSLALLDSNSISGHTGSFKCCAAGDGPRVFWILGLSMCSTNQQLGAGEVEAASKGRDR